MDLKIKPSDHLRGSIVLPSSKSYSIRALMIAALGGQSNIKGLSLSDDIKAAQSLAQLLGARVVELSKNHLKISAFHKNPRLSRINVNESGTSLRFILPLACHFATYATITGQGTLRGRPNQHLLQTLRTMGANIRGSGRNESIPIEYRGGRIKGGNVKINGSLSSQFISALLMTLPLLSEDSQLELTGKDLVSQDYITMTLQILKKSGIRVVKKNERIFKVPAKQKYKGLNTFTIPADYGLAAFPLAAAALIQSNVVLKGHFDDRLIQSDGRIMPFLKQMGVRWRKTSNGMIVQGPFVLKGGNFSLKNCPDLLPIMSILALFAQGKTRFYGIEHARVKESDRISDLANELKKIGAVLKEKRDELIIYPQKGYKQNAVLDPHHDHRLAMAFIILGIKIGVIVKDVECSHKSYPAFISDMKSVGMTVSRR